ncbi:MAG: AAA family ATPase [Psychrobacter sp.]|uniref:AAA family ATPase n=2 Tax=Psychrobacter TaxID=497 RepID=UPI0017879869|nr:MULTISPECIES: ATP-binding protein [unclassified Psychrobacter]MBE0442950.1 ATP-binding protein [Psychrobacter sp. FME13]
MNGNDAIVHNMAHNLIQRTPKSVTTIAVLGAESTGKTTLCRDLATHFDSLWVPEYMRTYLQDKWDKKQLTCTWDDLLPIAQGQIALENKLAIQAAETSQGDHYLFCDTSLFELMAYANWYYDDCPTELTHAALIHHYDLILLTDVDTPWVADDLRDSPHQRDEISAYFANQLTHHKKPFHRIGGNREQRVQQVANWLSHTNSTSR